jgi:hypothetical protein
MKKETRKKILDEMLDAAWDERDIVVDEPITSEELRMLKIEFYVRYTPDVREEYPGGACAFAQDINRVCLLYGDEIISDTIARP